MLSAHQQYKDYPQQIKEACAKGEMDRDVVCVICHQGPKSNGMPELHSLIPSLSNIDAKGYKVAIVSDGRMSGASGKIPAAIHVSPEAGDGGWIGRIRDGDIIEIDGASGRLVVETNDLMDREPVEAGSTETPFGCGRELFAGFRERVGRVEDGASVLF